MEHRTVLRAGGRWVVAMVLAATLWTTGALAQNEQAGPAPLTEEGHVPAWCGVRPAMDFVVGYDRGKRFFLVEDRAIKATQALLDASCPGDKVLLASFGLDVTWLGKQVTIQGDEDKIAIITMLKKRGQPTAQASINDNLVKQALKHWEDSLAEGALPVLVVYTDSIESAAPKRAGMIDFSWTDIPDYFQGRMLTVVNLLDHRAARELPTLYITTAPEGRTVEDFPANPRMEYTDLMEVFLPKPEPEVAPERVVIKRVETTRNPDWLVWLGTLEGSLSAGGAVFTLLTLFFLAGRLSRRQRRKKGEALPETIQGSHREVTLLLRDRLTDEVLRQETRVLREPLRVAPGSDADFVVPGPYAFEITDEGGENPIIRSTNMLGVELQRGVGRRLVVPEGEATTLRPNDRVDIGAGHEVEIQIH